MCTFLDLSLNSMLVFTAWSPDGRPYGGTSMHFFDGSGSLKIGKQKLIFFFDRRAENHVCSATPGELYDLCVKHIVRFVNLLYY